MIFQKTDYKSYLRAYLSSLPNKGRGFLTRFAHSIDMTQAQMSHVMSGEKDFTLEQAARAANYLGLSEIEAEYFLEMVILARAGNQELKILSKKKIEKLRAQALRLQNAIVEHKVLSDEEKSIFYSSWFYSAFRMFCSLKPQSLDELSNYFRLSRKKTTEITNFLVTAGLLINENSKFKLGQKSTFIDRESPLATKHHSNWRLKAIERSETIHETELMYTSPVSMSQKDFDLFRARLAELIKEFSKTVQQSPEEIVACLNIDFFHFNDPAK